MNLTPEIVADILVRQGYITSEQADTIRQEAKALPARLRNSSAFEQKALAYDLIRQLRLPNRRDSGARSDRDRHRPGDRRSDAKLDHIRIDTLNLNADLIESKMSRPFAKRHRMIPLDMATASCGWRSPTPTTSRASTPSSASPAATSSSSSPPSPTS